MKHIFVVLMLLLVIVPAGAVAQESTGSNGTDVNVSVDDQEECTETIDNLTALCSSRLVERGETTIAVMVIESKVFQRVTFVDSGGFMRGGDVNRDRGHRLRSGRNTVEFAVTEYQGYYGVAISTNNALYSEPLKETKSGFLPGEPQSEDPAIAALTMFSLFAVAFPVSYVGLKRYSGGVTDEL